MADLYVNEKLTLEKVGSAFLLDGSQVGLLFEKYGIATSEQSKSKKTKDKWLTGKNFIPKDILIDLYVNKKLMIIEIITQLDTTERVLYKILDFHGIPRKGRGISDYLKARIKKIE